MFENCTTLKAASITAMVVGGVAAIAGSVWIMAISLNDPVCGTDYNSAKAYIEPYSENSSYRFLYTNSCPGYDWTNQTSPYEAGETDYSLYLPNNPVICTSPTYVGESNPVDDKIGMSLNGIPIYSPVDDEGRDAVEYESSSFDQCSGHNHQNFLWIDGNRLETPGFYHYHTLPGDRDPKGHNQDLNVNFTLCDEITTWYRDNVTEHSPLVGFMADGIPIYGPRGIDGEPPNDLDRCGGHASDMNYYHYHYQSKYPYSVNCLWGKTDGTWNSQLNRDQDGDCEVAERQYDYSELYNFTSSYGGDGVNDRTGYDGGIALLVVGTSVATAGAIAFFGYVPKDGDIQYSPLSTEEPFEGDI